MLIAVFSSSSVFFIAGHLCEILIFCWGSGASYFHINLQKYDLESTLPLKKHKKNSSFNFLVPSESCLGSLMRQNLSQNGSNIEREGIKGGKCT